MAVPTGTLAQAISEADDQVTVLDDKVGAEDHAAYLWMRAHVLQGHPHVRVVVGTEYLPPGWKARTKQFMDAHFAEVYLQSFDHYHASMHALSEIAQSVSGSTVALRSESEIIVAVAKALASGQVWLIELPRRGLKSRFITKTDASAFAPINPRHGTKVDFAYIAQLEGDQWLRGYVPFKGKTGIVAGRSGMTVASASTWVSGSERT